MRGGGTTMSIILTGLFAGLSPRAFGQDASSRRRLTLLVNRKREAPQCVLEAR